jgi:hypothetical protein
MLPGAIAAAVLIPGYHLFGLLGGMDIVKKIIGSESNFDLYRPEEKERLLDIFSREREANVTVSKTTKKDITDKVAEVNTLFNNYQNDMAGHLDKYLVANPATPANVADGIKQSIQTDPCKKQYDLAQKRLNEDVQIFTRLVNDMGTPPQRYSPSDIINRAYRMKQRVNTALDKLFALELQALKDVDPNNQQLINEFTSAHEEKKQAIMKPMNEAIDLMQKATELQEKQEFTAMQQWVALEYLKSKTDSEGDVACITSNPDGVHLSMDKINMEKATELLYNYNEQARLQGNDKVTFTAKNGQRLEIIKNADSSFSLEFDLPRRLFSPFYYCSPYSNIKSATQDAISIYIAAGHIAKSGVLKLYINNTDEKTAKESAREQYLAAIESGLSPTDPKQFYLEINGRKLTNDEALEKCFPGKEDQARLQKSQGIATRNNQASATKWEQTKQQLSAYNNSPGKVEADKWKDNKAYDDFKRIKNEVVQQDRKVERNKEQVTWRAPAAPAP